jgi:hypothetical protein
VYPDKNFKSNASTFGQNKSSVQTNASMNQNTGQLATEDDDSHAESDQQFQRQIAKH